MQLFFPTAFWQSMWACRVHTDRAGCRCPGPEAESWAALCGQEDLGTLGEAPCLLWKLRTWASWDLDWRSRQGQGVWGDSALAPGDLTAVLTSPAILVTPDLASSGSGPGGGGLCCLLAPAAPAQGPAFSWVCTVRGETGSQEGACPHPWLWARRPGRGPVPSSRSQQLVQVPWEHVVATQDSTQMTWRVTPTHVLLHHGPVPPPQAHREAWGSYHWPAACWAADSELGPGSIL